MKRCLIFVLVLVFALMGMTAIAEPCPLPSANTDKEILFDGFEWYADYPTVKAAAKAMGMYSDHDIEHFGKEDPVIVHEYCTTPHWITLFNHVSAHSVAGCEMGCGGYIYYDSCIPEVKGYKDLAGRGKSYKADNLKLYFMWDLDNYKGDYKDPGAARFYMAKYELEVLSDGEDHSVADFDGVENCYKDLARKLRSRYGDESYDDGFVSCYWVNHEGAFVGASNITYSVNLVYMAPGAEERLVEVEEYIKRNRKYKEQKAIRQGCDFDGMRLSWVSHGATFCCLFWTFRGSSTVIESHNRGHEYESV